MKLGKTEGVMLDLALATKIGQLHEMRFSCFELSEAQKMEAQSAIKLLVILRKAAGTDEEFIRTLGACFEEVPHFQELAKIVQNFQSENPRLEHLSPQRPTLPNGIYQFTPSKEQKQYFRKMLLNVSTSLNWIHLEIMVALSPIPDNLKEYIRKGFQLFEELQRHGCISENDTELLDDFFSRFNLTRPLELLRAYQDRFQQVIYGDPPPTAPVYAQLPLQPSSLQDLTHPPSSLQSNFSSISSMSSLGSGRFTTNAEERKNTSHEHEFVSGIRPLAPSIFPPHEAQSSEPPQRFVPTPTSSTSETQNPSQPSSHSPLPYLTIPTSSPNTPGPKSPHTSSPPPSSLDYNIYPRPHDASHPSSFKPPSDHFPRPPVCGPVLTTQSPVSTTTAAKLAASIKSQPSGIYPTSQRLRKRPHEAREEQQIPPSKRTTGSYSLQETPQQPVSVPLSTPGRSVYPSPSTSASQFVSMRQREQQLPSMYLLPSLQSNQQSLASSQSSFSSTSSERFTTQPEQRQATGNQYVFVPGNTQNMPPTLHPSYPGQAASPYSSMSSGGSSLSSGGSFSSERFTTQPEQRQATGNQYVFVPGNTQNMPPTLHPSYPGQAASPYSSMSSGGSSLSSGGSFSSERFAVQPKQRQATGDQKEFVPGSMAPTQHPSYPGQTASRFSSMSSGGSSLSFQEPSFASPVQRQGSDNPSLPSLGRYVVGEPRSGGYPQSHDHEVASRAQYQQQKTEVIITPSILSEPHGNRPFLIPAGASTQLYSTSFSNSTSMSHGHESLWVGGAHTQQSEQHYASSQPSLTDEQQIHPSIEESGEEASARRIVYDQYAVPPRNYPSPKTAYTGPQNQPSELHQTREQAFTTNYSPSSSSEARVSLSGNPVCHSEQGDINVAIPSRKSRKNKKTVAATVQPGPPQASATDEEGESSTSEEEGESSTSEEEGDSSTSEEESGPPEPKRRRGNSNETSTESEEDKKPEKNANQGWTAFFGKMWQKVTGVKKNADKKTKYDDDDSDHYTSCDEDSDN